MESINFKVNAGTLTVNPDVASEVYAMAVRLRKYAAFADERVKAAGMAWYGEAQQLATDLAAEYNLTLQQAADCLALTSINCKWEVQVKYIRLLLTAIRSGCEPTSAPGPFLKSVKTNVARVLSGEQGVVKGEKIAAFAANIAGNHSYVTVDRWAVRAAVGRNTEERETQKLMKSGSLSRAKIDAAYHIAARLEGYTPAAYQAIVWILCREGLTIA